MLATKSKAENDLFAWASRISILDPPTNQVLKMEESDDMDIDEEDKKESYVISEAFKTSINKNLKTF